MPTAGEYKHEPSGIPCHCYVRRRLHHSTCKKSCLRKQSDSSSQYSDSRSKKVTFNPILRIRSYENQQKPEPESSPLLNDSEQPTGAIKSQNYDGSPDTNALCNKLTSLFGLNQQCKSFHDDKKIGRSSPRDHNNAVDPDDKMHSKKFCPICESKRNKSPVRGYRYQKTRERTPSPCGFHQQYQAAKATLDQSQNKNNATSTPANTPTFPTGSKYHVPRRLFRQDSLINSAGEISSQKDSSAGYENMNSLTYDSRPSGEQDGSSVYINGDTDKNPRPVSIFIKGDREENKLEEYIYEVPINNKNEQPEYDYITINNTARMQPDSQNNTTESSHSFTRLIKHKTEADLTSTNNPNYTLRPKNPAPRSAPDLQTVTSPYDVQLVSGRPQHPIPTDDEQVEMYAASGTLDKSELNAYNRLAKNSSPFIDILKMTPIAFFWTGCAFLIAMGYVFLFSCPYDQNNQR
ncbi:uncharacterized protein LOC135840335 [Planococcus citri]|uniref:uncharacterized protein LOC135840335 n=1 Tax=Planococcus citri TaxID=170843 RepID=UPI0031F9201B